MSESPDLLSAPLGDHRVLARPGPQRGRPLWILDPVAAAIWDAARAGLVPDEIAVHLAARFALPLEQVRTDVTRLLATWRGATNTAPTWTLHLADRRIALSVVDPELASRLEPLIAPLRAELDGPTNTGVRLAGTATDWQLFVDEGLTVAGDTADAAIAQTLAELVEAACATDQRLLVLHAAGVSQAGQGVVLIGRGGVGKTTLATALNASGWALLGDDVIPVTLDGYLLGVGLGPCLKAGSWPVLAPWLPDLEQTPIFYRAGQPVRIPFPPGPIERGPLPTAAFLFPRYHPGGKPSLEPLDPVRVLQGLIAAEAVIPELAQDQLLALTRWIGSAPGFALTYPTLDHALAMIAGLPLGTIPTPR